MSANANERIDVSSLLRPEGDQQAEPAIGPANNAAITGKFPVIRPANRPRSIDEVLAEINEQEAGLRRDQFPACDIRVVGGRLIAGDKEFHLEDGGFGRLCRRFSAPAPYRSSLSPRLRDEILQEHFSMGRFADRRLTDKTSFILSRDGTFLDIGRGDLFSLDNATVVRAVREGIGNHTDLEVQNLRLNDDCFSLDVVSPLISTEVRRGDVIRGGVQVTHSQVEAQATQVLAYAVRLICTNGLTQRQCLGEKRRSTPRTRRLPVGHPEAREMQLAQIRKLVADTWSGLAQKLEAITRLRDKPAQVQSALERFLRQAHLFSHSLMDRLLAAWAEEGSEASAFGALNALTRVATHATELAPWQRQRLSRLAGVYAGQDVHLCPHCFSVLVPRGESAGASP